MILILTSRFAEANFEIYFSTPNERGWEARLWVSKVRNSQSDMWISVSNVNFTTEGIELNELATFWVAAIATPSHSSLHQSWRK